MGGVGDGQHKQGGQQVYKTSARYRQIIILITATLMETPRTAKHHSTYTSPIGLLKHASSSEQQFFRLKSLRLQSELLQLREQNSQLRSQLNTCTNTITTLKQRLRSSTVDVNSSYNAYGNEVYTHRTVPSFVSEGKYASVSVNGSTSRRGSPSGSKMYEGERGYREGELERLLKQNRVIKNQHEVQVAGLKEEVKKQARLIVELQAQLETHRLRQEYQAMASQKRDQMQEKKLQRVNNQLRDEIDQLQRDKNRLEQKHKIVDENNKALRRQNQQLKVLASSKGRADTKVQQLQHQLQKQQKSHKQQIQKLNQQITTIRLKQLHQAPLSSRTDYSLQQIQLKQNRLRQNTIQPVNSKLQRENQLLRRKITIHERTLVDKDEQIKSMLAKLKPLLEKQRNKPQNIDMGSDNRRASLSLLEVFLKKYKINSF